MTFPSLSDIRRWDSEDPLRGFRDRFVLPPGVIYLDGNSLGALPRAAVTRVADTVDREWGEGLIRSWNSADWINAPRRVGAKIARIIGAKPHEVVVADSTSVNLYKLLMAGLRERPGRHVILSEPGNFPTDLYVAQGVSALAPGVEVRTVQREQIVDAINDDVAVVMLTHVHYKSGERFDMEAVTRAAHAHGALMLWDLSHTVAAIEVDLNAAGADLAVGCGYKYLNGGPGAPAFLFVSEALQDRLASPLTGWMGHAQPFEFTDDYAPASGIQRFLCGTPPILGIAALETGVDICLEAGMPLVAAKAQKLCSLFIDLIQRRCAGYGLTLATPAEPGARGSHVSFRHEAGYPIMQSLIEQGVIGDFRAPNIMRFGMTPLYVRYEDIWDAVEILASTLESRRWDNDANWARQAVT